MAAAYGCGRPRLKELGAPKRPAYSHHNELPHGASDPGVRSVDPPIHTIQLSGAVQDPTLRHPDGKGLHHEWPSRWLKSRFAMLSYKENAPQDGLGREIFPTSGTLAGADFF